MNDGPRCGESDWTHMKNPLVFLMEETRREAGCSAKSGPMRILTFCLLCALGLAEILLGFVGGLVIHGYIPPFAKEIELASLPSASQSAFFKYIRLFQEQWPIVSWFGLATIVLAVLMLFVTRRRSTLQTPPSAEQAGGGTKCV